MPIDFAGCPALLASGTCRDDTLTGAEAAFWSGATAAKTPIRKWLKCAKIPGSWVCVWGVKMADLKGNVWVVQVRSEGSIPAVWYTHWTCNTREGARRELRYLKGQCQPRKIRARVKKFQ